MPLVCLLLLVLSWGSVGDDLCPAVSHSIAGSAKCTYAGPTGPPIDYYCSGGCAGLEGAMACSGYISSGQYHLCPGCCMPGYQCCHVQGFDPHSGGWDSVVGCCKSNEVCCGDDGCVAKSEQCCNGKKACRQGACCGDSCCKNGVCLPGGRCCDEDKVCGLSCCPDTDHCVNGQCVEKEGNCTYLGVDLSPLSSLRRGNDTYITQGSSLYAINACGGLQYASRGFPASSCYTESVLCWGDGQPTDVGLATTPLLPYRDDRGNLALYGTCTSYGSSITFTSNITFVCASEEHIVVDQDYDQTNVTWRTPVVCSTSVVNTVLIAGCSVGGAAVLGGMVYFLLRVRRSLYPAYVPVPSS